MPPIPLKMQVRLKQNESLPDDAIALRGGGEGCRFWFGVEEVVEHLGEEAAA
jgi:hypothetical protein